MTDTHDFGTRDLPHIPIDAFREAAAYDVPTRPQNRKPRRDDYGAHSRALLQQLDAALGDTPSREVDQRFTVEGLKLGTVVEITTMPPLEGSRVKAIKVPPALDVPSQDISILRSDRTDGRTEKALLFVPDDARDFLRGRISAYGGDAGNQRRPDLDRFEVVETMQPLDVRSLFTGRVDFDEKDAGWWELWVPGSSELADQLAARARGLGIEVHADRLLFPDTTVVFVHTTVSILSAFAVRVSGAISEIRRSTGTIEVFLEEKQSHVTQHDWVADLVARVTPPAEDAPVICALDTGVAAAHPLIAPALRGAWAYDAAWLADDHYRNGGHGTGIVGLSLYGDLEPLMNDTCAVQLTHAAEAMKIFPPRGFPPTKPPSYGFVTQGAIASVEIERPNVSRSYCIAISATDFPASRPSTWSGALDQVAAGSMPGDMIGSAPASERPKRLIMVATGNVAGGSKSDILLSSPIEDPAQSWNALTIGGFTRKEQPPTPPPDLKPVVAANNRSPFSRGSQSLPDDLTPIKPELLFEAGNMLSDASDDCDWNTSVSLLSTGSDIVTEPLVPFWATSAAVGVAGHFMGRLQAALLGLWPETYRALAVNSASWPRPIRKRLVGRGAHWKAKSKADLQQIIREVGYGVPDIERAIMSARNDLTLIAQAEIQPFANGSGKGGVFNELHFYSLPWPKDALERLENEIVVMKVTLSYFIEPNLTGRAATRPDTYRSFGLRFRMKKRRETEKDFKSRITTSEEGTGAETPAERSDWLLGPNAMQAGSLHCDLWRGHAIDLASHDAIAVYPIGGWWKSHAGQRRINDKARYSLVISISASGHSVDLYTEVKNLVEVKTSVVATVQART